MAEEQERFTKNWLRSKVTSSQGYSVILSARTQTRYCDSEGEVHIFSEPLAARGMSMVVYANTIPDTASRPRSLVVERLVKVFGFAGWKVEIAWE